jgi:hypothetical protein
MTEKMLSLQPPLPNFFGLNLKMAIFRVSSALNLFDNERSISKTVIKRINFKKLQNNKLGWTKKQQCRKFIIKFFFLYNVLLSNLKILYLESKILLQMVNRHLNAKTGFFTLNPSTDVQIIKINPKNMN